MTRRVGVDIGGSGVRAARVTGGRVGRILRRPHGGAVDEVVELVGELTATLRADELAVGVPGRVQGGVVRGSSNLGWTEVPLAARLADHTGCRVSVDNDGNAATWGAWLQTDGRDLVLLTLGTGVGGGIVAGRQLVRGTGVAGELGHLYVGGDRPCGCGGRGCLETRCSTVGLVATARERGHRVRSGREVVEAAEAGESWAIDALTDAGRALGRALTSLVNALAPAHLRVVGGLAGAELLRAEAEAVLRGCAIPSALEALEVRWGGRAEPLAIRGIVALAGGEPEGPPQGGQGRQRSPSR